MDTFKSSTYPAGNFKTQTICNKDKSDEFRVQWYESGNMKSAEEYKHGKPDGLCISWHENGVKSHVFNADGSEKWYDNGQLSMKYEVALDKCIHWDDNGIKEYELDGNFIFDDDGFLRETLTFFDENGGKICSVKIEDNMTICLHHFYDENDNEIHSSTYDYEQDPLEIWQTWMGYDIEALTKILTSIEKHKELLQPSFQFL